MDVSSDPKIVAAHKKVNEVWRKQEQEFRKKADDFQTRMLQASPGNKNNLEAQMNVEIEKADYCRNQLT